MRQIQLLETVMSLSGAVALVTGGIGGLGERICSTLAAEGVNVAVGFLHGAESEPKRSVTEWRLLAEDR